MRRVALSLLAISGVLFFPVAEAADASAAPAAVAEVAAHGAPYQRFTDEMNQGMGKMMSEMHASGFSGDADVDFLAMMIPHHEGAADMARLVLQHGRDPVTRRLAEDIIASQQTEIEGMQRRLDALRRGASRSDPDGYPALGGTRGPAAPAR